MTNKEYIWELMNELFGEALASEEIIEDPKYIEFEESVEEEMKKDFAKLGCDTSVGLPTRLGFELWGSKVSKEMQEKFDKKYRNK